ncbi:hypothetical protein BGW37DRAFT_522943 [Umbelopsis sp. PMI_123]|nr:hypothetical protein BGW37DRAFT_522943 [Umbelopsis sp. PMI_123]
MSDSTAVGLRWNNGGSPKLPPVTSLYPDQKAEQSILEHTRDHWSSASHSSRSTVNASTCPLVEYDKNEISSNRKRNRDYVSNEQLYKRSWTDSRKYNITDAYGLNESDVDTILDCTADISGTLGHHEMTTSSTPSYSPSPIDDSGTTILSRSRSHSRGNLSDLDIRDLDRLVSKANQVVEIFERAKKRISGSSGPSTPQPTFSVNGDHLDPLRSKTETMEELAEISQQRRAIAMAGARSKPNLGTSSISMFRYADTSKKKPKRAGTEKLRCHSCHSTETPEWRKGPMGPRTLCNACGLIWAKLARKKHQSGDRFKLSRESNLQNHMSASNDTFTFNFSADPNSQQSENTLESSGSSSELYYSLQHSQVEPDICRQHTHDSRTDDSRGDKFKLSFLLD